MGCRATLGGVASPPWAGAASPPRAWVASPQRVGAAAPPRDRQVGAAAPPRARWAGVAVPPPSLASRIHFLVTGDGGVGVFLVPRLTKFLDGQDLY
jgi:hypothetical protein